LKEKIIKISERFSANFAYRILGFALRDITNNEAEKLLEEKKSDLVENNLTFVGFVGMIDPARESSRPAVLKAKEAGIRVIMITGDHMETAKAIGKEIGIYGKTEPISGKMLEKMSDEELEEAIKKAEIFARVDPSHKLRIINALKKHDEIVVMTGDGVNDAPALRKADIGIAVSNATDAAKSAADIVLTDPGVSVIINATEESRMIFERMKSYAVYRIAETVRILIFLVLSITIFAVYPITAVMIVILALLNDLPIMTIAFDNVRVAPKPVRWKMQSVMILSSVLGIAGVIFSFSIFLLGKFVFQLNIATLQTLIFLKLAVAGHMTIYLTRTDEENFWKRPFPSKILFIACESTQVVATIFAAVGVFMSPIGWGLAGFIWLFGFGAFVANNFIKVATIKWMNKRAEKKIIKTN